MKKTHPADGGGGARFERVFRPHARLHPLLRLQEVSPQIHMRLHQSLTTCATKLQKLDEEVLCNHQ